MKSIETCHVLWLDRSKRRDGIGCGREQQLDVTSIDGSNLVAIMHSTVGAVAGLSFGGVASIGVANSNGQTPLPTGRIRARVFGLVVDAG
jgi:hypothetical protein